MYLRKVTAIFICALTLSGLVFCKGRERKPADPRWSQYIKAHTSGRISRESNIRIVFQKELVKSAAIGKEAGGIIDFDPGISGRAEWSAPNEITFVPEDPLPSGKRYLVELDLKKWIKTPADLEEFHFNFEVIKQDFEISQEGLITPDVARLSLQEYRGAVITADVAGAKDVEKILGAEQDGKDLQIKWEHKSDRKIHGFVVQNIKRQEKDTELVLHYDGDSIDVDREGDEKIGIPARTEFKVLNVKQRISEGQFVEIRFSDPLRKKQNLRGMFRLDEVPLRISSDRNVIRLYPQRKISGSVRVIVDAGVLNSEGKKLGQEYSSRVTFESVKPGIRFIGRGTILPDNETLTVPFEAVNIHSVQVTAFKVFDNNMAQFLQVNNLEGKWELQRVGRYIWQRTLRLNASPETRGRWSHYELDVTELFRKNPNSLFRLTLTINRGNSSYRCAAGEEPPPSELKAVSADDWKVSQQSGWDYADYSQYDWADRKDPCKNAYYDGRYNTQVTADRNFFASNIGIIAKLGENGRLHVTTTDLRTAEPVSAEVRVFNLQNQVLGEGKTGGDGLGEIEIKNIPFYLVAKAGEDLGYLKLNGDSRLTLSHFDVGGSKVSRGVKGVIVGERGVWRPGDRIYLTFVLQDREDLIPDDHPIQLELFNPRGRLVTTLRNPRREDPFYVFETKTEEDAPTGNWRALVRLGGLTFSRELRVEAIVPNRLKVDLDFGRKVLHRSEMPLATTLKSRWLHGADASNLKADVSVRLSGRKTSFTRFKDYAFDDITRSLDGGRESVWSGRLDQKGEARFNLNIAVSGNPPGMLNAGFSSRVFEEGGGYSSESFRLPLHHYRNYVGLKPPRGDAARGMLLTDRFHKLNIASVNSRGEPVSLSNVEVNLYKVKWRYWWDKSGEAPASFTSSLETGKVAGDVIATHKGIGSWKFKIKYPQWGRYLLRACDREGGHCSTKIVYIDWPGWAGRAREENGDGATRLNFTADKPKYRVGDRAIIYLPAVERGRALVSLETGSRVLDQRWIETKKGKNQIRIPITEEMSPNFYVHITLIQPHAGRKNDRPLRLYGAIPITVENQETELQPVILAPDEIRPLKTVSYRVREKKGRKMTYTLAIVDEGLLGLTRFQTPDLHGRFYQKEALGVQTWDLFDDVAGAYSAALQRILAIGGGAADGEGEEARTKQRRYPPIVKFLGPFQLGSGDTNTHRIKLPQYIGSVRVMVVAAHRAAYGRASKSVAVRESLMMLATLPRVAGPGEELLIPVSVIANSQKISKVRVTMQSDSHLQIKDRSTRTISFRGPGEKLIYFRAGVADTIGRTRVVFRAEGNGVKTEQEIHLQIRSPNPRTARVTRGTIEPGKNWSTNLVPHGLQNTNDAALEISAIPPLNLDHRLKYLILYPHGCLEQTVSSVFPQLYLDSLQELSQENRKDIENNVKAGIGRLRQMQLSSGAFLYWPGGPPIYNEWATTYAGHFLLEAQKKGYYIPEAILKPWFRHQQSSARAFRNTAGQSGRLQAYRLFTLALARKPALGAMNRLRSDSGLDSPSRWYLAAAFQLAGQRDAARDLIQNESTSVKPYLELGGSFGSELRDEAIILYCLALMEQKERGKELVERISRALSSERWYSTQATSYSLLALARFVKVSGMAREFKFSGRIGNEKIDHDSPSPLFVKKIPTIPARGVMIAVGNPSQSLTIYTMLTSRGSPPPGEEQAIGRGIEMNVHYTDANKKPVSPDRIRHGEDIVAVIEVKNTSGRKYENLALTYIIPSGWQFGGGRAPEGTNYAPFDFQDVRDDRAYTYFGLEAGAVRSFSFLMNASYRGRYYLPGPAVEAMYDATIQNVRRGRWIEINK